MSHQEQQLFADQIKRLATEPHIFENGSMRFRNLLNDLLPGNRIERFWLCCALEMPSFVSALAQHQVEPIDVSRVEFFLHHKLGLSQNVAKWTSSIWAKALDFESPERRNSFNCPHCSLNGSCDERWRDRFATCPSCNAMMRFNSSLEISLEKTGWPKKRQRNRDWLLSDPDFFQFESSLRAAISKTIANDKLSSSEIAKHIGLDLIVSSLKTEISMMLAGGLNRSLVINGNIIKAVLRSSLRDEYLSFDLDLDFPSPSSLCEDQLSSQDEKWIAIIGSSSATPFHLLAFSERALYYTKDVNRWAVSYGDLHQLPITLEGSISQLRLGESRLIDLKGLGVPRLAIQFTLSLLGKLVYELSDGVWR